MIRRLELAQAILHRPPVLFLDEPTIGLDPVARETVWQYVGQLAAAGTTVVLTTHYLEEADRMCDRVAIMDRGRIVAIGSPEELKRSIGDEKASLHKVFEFYIGDRLEAETNGEKFTDVRRTRRTARRLG